MSRTLALLFAVSAVALAAAGCQFKAVTVDYSQPIRAEIEETSGMNPVRVVMTIDGREPNYFEADLTPGRPYRFFLHNPDPNSTVRPLEPGKHRIWWRIHKNHPYGKVGNARVTIYSGDQTIATNNSRWVMPLFATDYFLNVKIEKRQAAAPPPEAVH